MRHDRFHVACNKTTFAYLQGSASCHEILKIIIGHHWKFVQNVLLKWHTLSTLIQNFKYSLANGVLSSGYITLCSPVKVNRRFEGTYRLHLQSRRVNHARNLYETGSKHMIYSSTLKMHVIFFQNVGSVSPNCPALCRRNGTLHSHPPLWEPQIRHTSLAFFESISSRYFAWQTYYFLMSEFKRKCDTGVS
jgi:hypothetical protein